MAAEYGYRPEIATGLGEPIYSPGHGLGSVGRLAWSELRETSLIHAEAPITEWRWRGRPKLR